MGGGEQKRGGGWVRWLPSEVNIGDNWSDQLALIRCYCCDNKHFRTAVMSQQPQKPRWLWQFWEDPWGIFGVPSKCDCASLNPATLSCSRERLSLSQRRWRKTSPWCGGASATAGACEAMRGVPGCGGDPKEGACCAARASLSPWHILFEVMARHLLCLQVPGVPPTSLRSETLTGNVRGTTYHVWADKSLAGSIAHSPWAHGLKINE